MKNFLEAYEKVSGTPLEINWTLNHKDAKVLQKSVLACVREK